MNNEIMFSSQTDQHNTPRWLVEKIADFLGGIYLDPCTDASNPTCALHYYTEANNGLAQEWVAPNVYMNPPYGRGIGNWTEKLHVHYALGDVQEAIALLPARTDTRWWKVLNSHPVLFVRGRLKFNDCGQSAPFPSALIYMGEHLDHFERDFGEMGTIYLPLAFI